MTGLCLLLVLIVAKVSLLVAVAPSWSLSMLGAFTDDFVVAGVWVIAGVAVRSRPVLWTMYGLAAIYTAINVPIGRVLGSPLTPTLIRAAGGPLADSIRHYLTPANVMSLAVVLAAAVSAPWILSRISVRRLRYGQVLVVGAAFLGLVARDVAQANTSGLSRNAFTALMPLTLRAAVDEQSEKLSESEFTPGTPPLDRFKGAAAGLNVVIVVLESTTARYLRTYGAAADPTPHITKLAEHAIVFENAYAVYPESIKELFAEFCSRYPAFDEPVERLAAAPCSPLPRELGSAGYTSGLFHSGRFDYLGMAEMLAGKGFDVLEDAGDIGGHHRSSFGVDEAATVDRILAWIDRSPTGRPFFIAYLPIAGHHPYASSAPGPFDDVTEFGRYQNALHEGDAAIGDLLEGLRRRALFDRTVFVVFGDHGEAFGQHAGNIGHTMFVDEENVHVPYFIALPGVSTSIRVASIASVIDTAPTVLDLIGLPPSPDYQGDSLLSPRRARSFFLADYSLGFLGLREGCWKYVLQLNGARSSLFDVCRDPDERQDRSADWPTRVRTYRSDVQRWSLEQKGLVSGRSDVMRADRHAEDRQQH
jgi:hypothetical protein